MAWYERVRLNHNVEGKMGTAPGFWMRDEFGMLLSKIKSD